MGREYVARWLAEREPEARIEYTGVNEEAVHIWEMAFPGGGSFRLGVTSEVVLDEGLLAERLMEMENQGWLDRAGEEDLWALVTPAEVARGD